MRGLDDLHQQGVDTRKVIRYRLPEEEECKADSFFPSGTIQSPKWPRAIPRTANPDDRVVLAFRKAEAQREGPQSPAVL